jgi:hypothetical protein
MRRAAQARGSALRAVAPWALACAVAAAQAQTEDPAAFVRFVQEDDATCMMREGRMVLVASSHPSRRIRCWLERRHMGVPTGDRSRADLAPGGEPEKLGCSRTDFGAQEWRVVRAEFVN